MSHLHRHNDNEKEEEIVRPSDHRAHKLGYDEAYYDRGYVEDIGNHPKLIVPSIDRTVSVRSVPPHKQTSSIHDRCRR